MGFIFYHQNLLGNERWVFRGRDSHFVLCSWGCLLYSHTKHMAWYLLDIWLFPFKPLSFSIIFPLPTPWPLEQLHNRVRHWRKRACRRDEECSFREWGRKKGGSGHWGSNWGGHTHLWKSRRMGCQHSAASLHPCADEADGGSDLPALCQRIGRAEWLIQVGWASACDKIKWCRVNSNGHIYVTFKQKYKVLFIRLFCRGGKFFPLHL